MNQLVSVNTNGIEYRQSTDAAGMCRDIVTKTATAIQGRKYVSVEGWQAIAIAHGCAAGARDVEKVEGGVRAIGEIRRMCDGQVFAVAEGFVGEDESTWYGGPNKYGKILPKRPDYAIRAMAQTRAISRACRSAFAHVVVMIDAGLETTPAEEVPEGGFNDYTPAEQEKEAAPKAGSQNGDVLISGEQRDQIATLAPVAKMTLQQICKLYEVKSIAELTARQGAAAIKRLKELIEQERKKVADDLDDDVPY